MAKIPYFPFYTDDWLSSDKVMVDFDDSERGIHITLLAIAWNRPGCCLPSDIEKVRLLCRSKRRAKVENVLRTCWELTENGWRNEREHAENMIANSKHEKAVLAAKSRYNKDFTPANAERTQSERTAIRLEPDKNQIRREESIRFVDKPPIKSKFTIPTIGDIKKYCLEKGYLTFDAEKFHAYYESNGWRVGKNPMKSWTAALTTWRKNDFGGGESNGLQKQAGRGSRDFGAERDAIRKQRIESACDKLGISQGRTGFPSGQVHGDNERIRNDRVDAGTVESTCMEVVED